MHGLKMVAYNSHNKRIEVCEGKVAIITKERAEDGLMRKEKDYHDIIPLIHVHRGVELTETLLSNQTRSALVKEIILGVLPYGKTYGPYTLPRGTVEEKTK